ncbi:hypothetical protein P0136_00220 [Lentisphaerota bacterium ZTH]|nr:hypothetical protein JYG24_08635 [Lentisphaerota bacterium]WET06441.1 hypothetical protein P0136_00220 [Lentisphaerota bacterium ZTH]
MDKNSRFGKFAETLTAGLGDDYELRLDVQQEVKAHLEDSYIKHKKQGKTDSECIKLAIKSFGSSEQISSDLVAANRRRMKLHALTKLIIKAVIVPAAVILAVFLCVERFMVYKSAHIFNDSVSEYAFTQKQPNLNNFDTKTEKYIAYANYVTSAMDKYRDDLPRLTEILIKAEQLEPDNARYNYLLAGVMLKEATENPEFVDQRLLDQTVDEVIKGSAKPYYKRYARETLAARMKVYKDLNVEAKIAMIKVAAAANLPDIYWMRKLVEAFPFCSRLLSNHRNDQKATELLNSWLKILKGMNSDSFCLGDTLLISRLVNVDIPKAYKNLGCSRQAARTELFQELYNKTEKSIWPERKTVVSNKGRKHFGFLVETFLSEIGGASLLSTSDIAIERELEYTVLERYAVNALIIFFLFFMIISIVLSIFYRISKATVPAVLISSFKESIKILGIGVILPVTVYFIYSKLTNCGLREFGINHTKYIITGNFCLLTVTVITLTIALALKNIVRRCQDLGIVSDEINVSKRDWWLWGMLAALWLLTFMFTNDTFSIGTACLSGLLLLAFFVLLFLKIRRLSEKQNLIYCTIASSLVSVFAFAIILIACTVYPALEMREKHLIANDKLLIPGHSELPVFTRMEGDIVLKMKKRTDKVFAKLAKLQP